MHLKIIRMCRTGNITVAALIAQLYELINVHQGINFNDLNDLFNDLYPKRG